MISAAIRPEDGWVLETADEIWLGCKPENPPSEASLRYVREVLKPWVLREREEGRGLPPGQYRLHAISPLDHGTAWGLSPRARG